ncbi:MAG TPA: hypothetical protein VH684_15385 [Xanthobacteraceae bacterium]
MIEFSRATHDGEPPLWVDLYDHVLGVAIDSCRCSDLDEAVSATEHLLSQARLADRRETGDSEADSS